MVWWRFIHRKRIRASRDGADSDCFLVNLLVETTGSECRAVRRRLGLKVVRSREPRGRGVIIGVRNRGGDSFMESTACARQTHLELQTDKVASVYSKLATLLRFVRRESCHCRATAS